MDLPVVDLDPAADPALAAELVTLQRTAYRVEARLIGSDAIPQLAETPAVLVAAGLTWLGVRDGTDLAGAVGYSATAELVDVERLVVAPRAFRRGIGATLVAEVLVRAAGRRVIVATGRDNLPARALYRRSGFTETGEHEVAPGLVVVTCAWQRSL